MSARNLGGPVLIATNEDTQFYAGQFRQSIFEMVFKIHRNTKSTPVLVWKWNVNAQAGQSCGTGAREQKFIPGHQDKECQALPWQVILWKDQAGEQMFFKSRSFDWIRNKEHGCLETLHWLLNTRTSRHNLIDTCTMMFSRYKWGLWRLLECNSSVLGSLSAQSS